MWFILKEKKLKSELPMFFRMEEFDFPMQNAFLKMWLSHMAEW